MKKDNTTNNVLYFQNTSKVSDLGKEYCERYGSEFVEDLNAAYLWMIKDMQAQLPKEEVKRRRLRRDLTEEEMRTVYYVDLPNENLFSVTIDELGEKTIYNFGNSPRLRNYNNNANIRYLLSGMFFYDIDKTTKWLESLVGPGERFWYETY